LTRAMAVRRVAVTGAGVVSPLGSTLENFHRALCDARPGIRRLPADVAQGSGVQVGAMIDWNPAPLFKEAEAANLDRATQFALAAAGQAIRASGIGASERTGVYWGTGLGGSHTLEAAYKHVYGAGEWRVRPLTVIMAMNNAAGSNVAVRHRLRGPFANFATACSSSAMALGEAMRTIQAGRADAMIAGGSEALLTPGTLVAWQALRTLAESRLTADAIGYVNAHGTATAVGDIVEAEAINAVFGEAAARVPVSSTKSLHGHLLGGAGALEFAAALLPLMRGWLPPTAFL